MQYRYLILCLFLFASCRNSETDGKSTSISSSSPLYPKGSFGYDVEFLKTYHNDMLLLGEDSSGPQMLILPAYQGRVMTSSAEGFFGKSFGWVNHELIASRTLAEHINVFGGEERFWIGPEGGQFSIYFKKGVDFSFENWYVPKALDTEPFGLVTSNKREATFQKEMHFENYSGSKFDLLVDRTIRLLSRSKLDSVLGITLPSGIKLVGFESINRLTNKGTSIWDKRTGMLSIWILSMLNASEKTSVIIPYKQGDSTKLGKILTDDYFGKIPAEKLKVKNGIILFKADANYRSKIGISPKRALPLMGSYDEQNNVLTIAQFSLPDATADYVNSLWKIQDDPFSGDAVNSYNDGKLNGKQLGKFYELESSSPAAALEPGESLMHIHRTIHIKGSKEELDKIAIQVLGVSVKDILF